MIEAIGLLAMGYVGYRALPALRKDYEIFKEECDKTGEIIESKGVKEAARYAFAKVAYTIGLLEEDTMKRIMQNYESKQTQFNFESGLEKKIPR